MVRYGQAVSDDDALKSDPLGPSPRGEDRNAAHERAVLAMREGRHEDALAAANEAIEALLHAGLTLDDFLRFSQRGAQSEGLMRFEQGLIAALRQLHEPLAIRWEALRRTGQQQAARQMRAVCLKHFGGRASVWATAGNQALDEGELDAAQRYFDGCLRLSPNWPAALAGTAIVFESRKDWHAALRYRERVVEVCEALAGDDGPSLQRVLRYAAALGRVGRWQAALPLFVRCVRLGAFVRLPAERPVMLRVFSRELYAPSVVASLRAQAPAEFAALSGHDADVALALQQAHLLASVYRNLQRCYPPGGEALMMLGACAWLAGETAAAHGLFDEAEIYLEGDLAIHYLLVSTASGLDIPDRAGIERFALEALHAAEARALASAPLDEDALLYARLLAGHFSLPSPALDALWHLRVAESALLGACEMASAATHASCPALPVLQSDGPSRQLRRLVAFGAAQRAAGRCALEVALASSDALIALEAAVAALARV